MVRGEIWEADLGPMPLAQGSQQAGIRPAVIVDANPNSGGHNLVTIIPFTRKLAAARFSPNLQVNPNPANGLTATSVLLLFQIRALDMTFLMKRIGVLDAADMTQMDQLLKSMLGL